MSHNGCMGRRELAHAAESCTDSSTGGNKEDEAVAKRASSRLPSLFSARYGGGAVGGFVKLHQALQSLLGARSAGC